MGVSSGPCPNLTRLAESKGILISRGKLDAEGLDAFSQWSDFGRPFAVLGSDKASAVRSRFDLAHEIGRLILHSHVADASIASAKDYKLLETQAHRFASAFLLPSKDFANDLYAPTLDAFRLFKPRWKVSIGAMIMRCVHLSQCVKMMVDDSFKSKEQIIADLKLSASDIEEMCGLDRGYLSSPQLETLPKPRFGGSNIIQFNS